MQWLDRREGSTRQPDDRRTDSEVDYARVIHSSSFRRLQGKTQILNLGDGDFYRTRLTHSLEVAQIAVGLRQQLRGGCPDHPALAHLPENSQLQAIALSHDLGHSPFGHAGEIALNYCMRRHGGFEANGQTLRILSKLEKFSEGAGSNLTRRTLLGVLKYPAPYSTVFNPDRAPRLRPDAATLSVIDREISKPPKCYLDSEQDAVDWILAPLSDSDRNEFQAVANVPGAHRKPHHKSFDCSIMDLADDIAFGVHDLEDALALGLIAEEQFRQAVPPAACDSFLEASGRRGGGPSIDELHETMVAGLFSESRGRKRVISRMVHHLVTSVYLDTADTFAEPLIRYRLTMEPSAERFMQALQGVVRIHVIESSRVQQSQFRAQAMILAVFEALSLEPKSLLSSETYCLYEASEHPQRVVCDHVAGMTDAFLLRTYDRLFNARSG